MVGRKKKESADYFPHDSDASFDEKIKYLESIFGNTGYALFFKFLERMARSKQFKIEWNEIKKNIYATEFGISVTEIDNFVTESCRNEIKAFILEEGFLYSEGLIKRFKPLVEKREYNQKQYYDRVNKNKNNSVTEKGNSVTEKPISATKKTQSRVEESRVEESIKETPKNSKTFTPPKSTKKQTPETSSGTFKFKSKKVKNNNGTENLSDIFLNINSVCDSILKLPKDSKRKKTFDPRQWAQSKITEHKHPGAIHRSLDGLKMYWDRSRDPWCYADTILGKVNGNFNESDNIAMHNELKGQESPDMLLKLTAGLLKEI